MDLLHYSNLGEISWYLFAKKIIEISKKNVSLSLYQVLTINKLHLGPIIQF